MFFSLAYKYCDIIRAGFCREIRQHLVTRAIFVVWFALNVRLFLFNIVKMVEQSNQILYNLLNENTGFPIVQERRLKRYEPPPQWIGPPPPRGCVLYMGNMPINISEDELIPLLTAAGPIYDLRLMAYENGSNRVFGFVTYFTKYDAAVALHKLNRHEIRPGIIMKVCLSNDNRCLMLRNIPLTIPKSHILYKLHSLFIGIVNVNFFQKNGTGYAFVTFMSHGIAVQVRNSLVKKRFRLWGIDIFVDWSRPNHMKVCEPFQITFEFRLAFVLMFNYQAYYFLL